MSAEVAHEGGVGWRSKHDECHIMNTCQCLTDLYWTGNLYHMSNYNYHNTDCRSCGKWVWKGEGVWHRSVTYCRECWAKRNAK